MLGKVARSDEKVCLYNMSLYNRKGAFSVTFPMLGKVARSDEKVCLYNMSLYNLKSTLFCDLPYVREGGAKRRKGVSIQYAVLYITVKVYSTVDLPYVRDGGAKRRKGVAL